MIDMVAIILLSIIEIIADYKMMIIRPLKSTQFFSLVPSTDTWPLHCIIQWIVVSTQWIIFQSGAVHFFEILCSALQISGPVHTEAKRPKEVLQLLANKWCSVSFLIAVWSILQLCSAVKCSALYFSALFCNALFCNAHCQACLACKIYGSCGMQDLCM